MNPIARFFKKCRILLRRETFNSELEEEMAFHREQKEKAFEADGMIPEAAHYAAMRQFGNEIRLREQSREVIGFRLETVFQDFRFAIRQLRKNPGFACTAILILALGMSASVAIFTFVDATLIKPLPYQDPNRLVAVTESVPLFPRANLSYPDYLDWKRLNKVFSSLDVWTATGYLLNSSAGVQPVTGTRVTDGFFRTLGIHPILGRDFRSGEDLPAAPRTIMLSYIGWQKWFSGKRDVIGRPITLSGVPYTVIGVLPRGFQFAPRGKADFWATLHPEGDCDLRRSCHALDGVARLKDGVSVLMALAEMTSIAQQLERQYPDSNRGQGASVIPLSEAIVGNVRPVLLVLLAGAGLLLFIACVNVASLLLVRSESRRREMAVRGALGASPARLIRQFVTEGLVLVAASSVLGLAAAWGAMHLLILLIPTDLMGYMPYLQGLGLNLRVLAFAAVISLLAALLFSITPALRLSLSNMRSDLAEGSRGSAGALWRRFGANFVVLQLAIAMVLLTGAGLLGKSFYRLLHVELGFQPDHLATLLVEAPDTTYAKDPQLVALGRQVVSRIGSLPGVRSVSLTTRPPITGNGDTDWIRFVGRPYDGHHIEVNEREVSSAYFTTLQAKLLRGRYLTDEEDASKPLVVVINQALAKRYFPGENPIGKRIGDTQLSPKSIKEIVGVVDDIKEGSLDSDIWPAVYYPFNQNPDNYFDVIARTSQSPASILPAMTAAIHQVDPNLGTVDGITMTGKIHDSPTTYVHRSAAWLVGGFAALALLLGVVGLYGVIAYSVSQRTREIGVRIALGAQRGSVYRLILKEAGWLTAIGIAAGLVCSIAAAMLMRNLLFGTQAWDAPTLIAVAAVLAVSALLASYIPARRAASVNPIEALRAE